MSETIAGAFFRCRRVMWGSKTGELGSISTSDAAMWVNGWVSSVISQSAKPERCFSPVPVGFHLRTTEPRIFLCSHAVCDHSVSDSALTKYKEQPRATFMTAPVAGAPGNDLFSFARLAVIVFQHCMLVELHGERRKPSPCSSRGQRCLSQSFYQSGKEANAHDGSRNDQAALDQSTPNNVSKISVSRTLG